MQQEEIIYCVCFFCYTQINWYDRQISKHKRSDTTITLCYFRECANLETLPGYYRGRGGGDLSLK